LRGGPQIAAEPLSRDNNAAVHVQLDAADVVEFLELTQTVVRLGNESAHLDLDAALKTLVA
jgi:hypothetical protein